jgi:hypothetical protein
MDLFKEDDSSSSDENDQGLFPGQPTAGGKLPGDNFMSFDTTNIIPLSKIDTRNLKPLLIEPQD